MDYSLSPERSAYAELSASLPYAGGDYIYIREAYGKLMGFLIRLVFFPGDILRRNRIPRGKLERVYGFFLSGAAFRNDYILSGNTMGADHCHSGDNICHRRRTAFVRPALSRVCVKGTMVQNILTILKIGALLGIIVIRHSLRQRRHGAFCSAF